MNLNDFIEQFVEDLDFDATHTWAKLFGVKTREWNKYSKEWGEVWLGGIKEELALKLLAFSEQLKSLQEE